ncbi:hypothetical protein COO91_08040 [Nostoc flagelliforme CCNUN1]|uniref:Uncharacterized protein n=1 Tax=Nostoc flagelliforme CCNUN1 TaxID=2038116 RepID=A0A2K8T2R2_9NOSO|nr:hypothetical protein [Nostoc flagelliforme]AUB41949.1 hypothetical protein COO91_08040 [Nostoc flagelliforme CCNUN1]
MKTAYFHRAYWCYENNLGIAKIHHGPLGIFAILFENGIPIINVNFLKKDEFSYYWQKYKKQGISLHLGMKVGIDTELTRVIEKENIFKFPEINLEVKLENNTRYFRSLDGEWTEFEDDVFVEYKPCDSLVDVR